MKISLNQSYSFCQKGLRDYQEDCRWPNSDIPISTQRFFIVCDGVGGCNKGELASQTVCEAMAKSMEQIDLSKGLSPKQFSMILDSAYDALDVSMNDSNRDMATTMTFLCFHSGGCTMAHIGDSRIFHYRKGEGIIYKSNDHSLINHMVHEGKLSPEQAVNHPKRNVIMRYMSPVEDDEERWEATMTTTSDIAPDDIFILCTDGVTQCVDDKSLMDILESKCSDKNKLDKIAAECFYSTDNNTCILVSINGVSECAGETSETDCINTKRLKHKVYKTLEIESHKPIPQKGFIRYLKQFFNF